MTNHSDLVAEIEVVDIQATGSIPSDAGDLPYVDFDATVMDLLAGNGASGREIVIRQTGAYGADGEVEFEISDDPLIRAGDEFVAFLHESEEGVYFIGGGPTGRLPIEGERVYQLDGSELRADEVPESLTELSQAISTQ
ncbi:hypothetical protein [Ruania rhizosphaerae]|uniref:hypothetical protein n=1 Tax=Ruania rhizosphaerae TaxID=1840413 RepID=UPI00135A0C28|nr:hypothetical protein [Ruania rhizosphaerae]